MNDEKHALSHCRLGRAEFLCFISVQNLAILKVSHENVTSFGK